MKKTKLIVFRPRPIDLAHYISVVMDDNVVEQVESTKFIGVVRSPSWSVQLPYSVCETAFSQVGLFLD